MIRRLRQLAAAGLAPDVAVPDPANMPNRLKYLIFGVMAFGQFMALLDIQIVASSLNNIQAGLSAGPDEISWIQTAYLMAELVMIPFSAFLTQAISTRWLFALSAGLFTISSVLCGMAWNIESMIVFRAIQGFTGGAMVPTVFGTGYQLFAGRQRAMIPAILGMVSVLAPTLGPTVGGVITEFIDWRWVFFINVIPGAAVTVAIILLGRIDQARPEMLKKTDWVHLASMALALAALEYVLEEGPRHDWFNDPTIATAAWLSLVAFVLFIERSFFSSNPVVKLTPFRKPIFAIACLFNLVIGFGIYSSTYLVPVYLGRVRGYNALQIGLTVFIVGVFQLLSTVVAARTSVFADRRIFIAIGLTGFAFSLWLASQMTASWGFWELLWPQSMRGLSVMLCIVPSVGLAMSSFEGLELRYASGLFNLMRNLGGAIGIAVVNTWLGDSTRIAAARFGETLGRQGTGAMEAIRELASGMGVRGGDPMQAVTASQALFARIVGREAMALAFDDVFRLMDWMFVAALIFVPFCKPSAPPAETAAEPVEVH